MIAAVVVVALVVGGVVVRNATDDDDTATADNTSTSTTTTSTTTTGEVDSDYAVGTREETFIDHSRPTDALPEAGVAASPDRTLRTLILYPADGEFAAPGPFPLVMFSHGSGGSPEAYAPLVSPLVELGYVVALPRFPLTSVPGSPVTDVVNQPADVSFVLDQLLGLSAEPSGWLAGRLDPDRIAAAGHSLGAVTTLGLTYDSCCIDDRIDAAVALSGIAVPSSSGSLDNAPPTPLLLVHGARDETVPVSGSDALFEAATGPAYFLRLDDADHVNFGFGEDGALTGAAVDGFLDAELKDDRTELDAMPQLVADSARGQWLTRN